MRSYHNSLTPNEIKVTELIDISITNFLQAIKIFNNSKLETKSLFPS